MTARPDRFVGLRYASPDGRVSYCYNTKHALCELRARGGCYTSNQAELELLFSEPVPGIPLHPTPDWDPSVGTYRSGV